MTVRMLAAVVTLAAGALVPTAQAAHGHAKATPHSSQLVHARVHMDPGCNSPSCRTNRLT